ncbi:MAG: SDR family oxidoreductase [Bacteroidia bacterium]
MKKKLLVTGTSGFLGWNVVKVARERFYVSAQYRTHDPQINGVVSHQANLEDEISVINLLGRTEPDFIIHCAAASHPNFCEQNPDESYKANILANEILSKHCAERGIKLVFTSSDLVFDGTKGNYAEDDTRNPIMLYGEHKAKAEDIILKNAPNSAICRMPLMFGPVGSVGVSFIQGFIQKFKAGESLGLFYDEIRNTLFSDDAANGLIMAAEHVSGILHLGGRDALSRYDFGLKMADAFGFERELILRISNDDVKMAAPRAKDASMNCSMAFAIGFKPKLVGERLSEMALF